MRILGHVNYGPSKPREKPEAPARVLRRAPSLDEFHGWLVGFAERGERAPTLLEINNRWGAGASKHLPLLVRAGRAIVEVGNKNFRVIRLGGMETARPKGWRPYLLVNKDGRFYRRGDRWVPKPASGAGAP